MKLDARIIGSIIIVFSLLLAAGIWTYTSKINQLIELQMSTGENCIVEGKCIHEEYKATEITIVVSILITLMVVFGVMLVFQKKQEEEQIKSSLGEESSGVSAVHDVMHELAMVKKGLSEDEKKILTEIEKEKEITQDSLRFRLEWSKAKVSTILTHLDKMGIIQRRREGKTYIVFLSKQK